MGITIEIPGLRLVSEANTREHWAVKAKRAKQQRSRAWIEVFNGVDLVAGVLPATITITRIGPRALDTDNAAGSMKHVQDGIADAIGTDDGSDLYTWVYRQEKGAYGVRITITPRRCAACGKADAAGQANVTSGGTPWCGSAKCYRKIQSREQKAVLAEAQKESQS